VLGLIWEIGQVLIENFDWLKFTPSPPLVALSGPSHSMTLTCSKTVIPRSCDSPSFQSCYRCVPHTYNYPYASPLPIPIANCPKPSNLLIITMQIKSVVPLLASTSFSPSSLCWFYFQNLKGNAQINIGNIPIYN
jgi:hypothetical protein